MIYSSRWFRYHTMLTKFISKVCSSFLWVRVGLVNNLFMMRYEDNHLARSLFFPFIHMHIRTCKGPFLIAMHRCERWNEKQAPFSFSPLLIQGFISWQIFEKREREYPSHPSSLIFTFTCTSTQICMEEKRQLVFHTLISHTSRGTFLIIFYDLNWDK